MLVLMNTYTTRDPCSLVEGSAAAPIAGYLDLGTMRDACQAGSDMGEAAGTYAGEQVCSLIGGAAAHVVPIVFGVGGAP